MTEAAEAPTATIESHEEVQRRLRALEQRAAGAERTARWMRRGAVALVLCGVSMPLVASGLGNVPNTFSTGAPIEAAQMNANFQHLVDGITGVEDRFVASRLPAFSAGSGIQGFTNTSYTAASGMVATLTTSGNPVQVSLVADEYDAGQASYIYASAGAPSDGYFQIERGGVPICQVRLQAEPNGTNPTIPPGFSCIDTGAAAGAHNYTLRVRTGGSGNVALVRVRLMALELGYLP